MFKYNEKTYDNIWFTSDEHYGSERQITLSRRLDFDINIKKEKFYNDKTLSKRLKHIICNSFCFTIVTLDGDTNSTSELI